MGKMLGFVGVCGKEVRVEAGSVGVREITGVSRLQAASASQGSRQASRYVIFLREGRQACTAHRHASSSSTRTLRRSNSSFSLSSDDCASVSLSRSARTKRV